MNEGDDEIQRQMGGMDVGGWKPVVMVLRKTKADGEMVG